MASEAVEFFQKKKPWSEYKDLILKYYLKPYLSKVAKLKRPIAVVDCFAGAGRFEQDGKPGSPLIIAERLDEIRTRGVKVKAVLIEAVPELYQRLQDNTAGCQVPTETRFGDFRDHVGLIVELARDHTVFLYLDPFTPKELLFNDLRLVYDQLHAGQSIEALINFPSTAFLRIVRGLQRTVNMEGGFPPGHKGVLSCKEIAGGTYWQDIALDASLSNSERVDQLAAGYAGELQRWFRWVLHYPIREKYPRKLPKYHMVFGSRSPDAVDLMNRAMVKARREFVGAEFVKGFLFANEPKKELIDPSKARELILTTANRVGKTRWKLLRVHATIACPCFYTDSELNRAIKELVARNELGSTATGAKIENSADVWPMV